MQFDIQCTDDCADDDLAEHARRRLRFGLTRHGAFVRQVQVRLGREPAGDWVCRIRVSLLDGAPAEIETHGPDAHSVIDLAVDRSARLVGRRFARPRPAAVQLPVGPAPAMPARRPRQRPAGVDPLATRPTRSSGA